MSLVFNILTDGIGSGMASYAAYEMGVIKKLMHPKLLYQFGIFLKRLSVRYGFCVLYYLRPRIVGLCSDEYVCMIFHNVHCICFKYVTLRYPVKAFFYMSFDLIIKYLLPVFGYLNLMIFEIINSMFSIFHSHAVFPKSYSISLSRA